MCPAGAAYHAETSESEHRTSRSHLPLSTHDHQGAFHNSQRQTILFLKLPFTIWKCNVWNLCVYVCVLELQDYDKNHNRQLFS